MFAAFTIMRQLHELLWYLTEALTLQPARSLHHEVGVTLDETERLTRYGPESLCELDVAAHRRDVNALLTRASALARAGVPRQEIDHSGADLIGADLHGADLRGADVGGADLAESIFVTQSQLDAAKGDTATKVPRSLTRPTTWPPAVR